MSEEVVEKLKSERDSLLKAADQRYQSAKDKYEEVRIKYNDLVQENNQMRQQFEERQAEFEAMKKISKDGSTKLLLQVAEIQKEKTKLSKALEAKEKENQQLRTENAENETFMEAVRQEIIDFRDAKNAQVEKLQQELSALKQSTANVAPAVQTDREDQYSEKLERLEAENAILRKQVSDLKDSLTMQRRSSQKLQDAQTSDTRTFDELKHQLESVAKKLSEVEDHRQQLKIQKMEMEEKLHQDGGDSAEGKGERARKTSLAVLIEGKFPSRERKQSGLRDTVNNY